MIQRTVDGELRPVIAAGRHAASVQRRPGDELGLAPRVLDATQGQPLFARFVSQDVAAQGEAVLAQLEADPPAAT